MKPPCVRRPNTAKRRFVAAALLLGVAAPGALAQTVTLKVATFPDLDRAVKAAVPRWRQLHPNVDVKVVSLAYADHHTAMTTALATGAGLPDVMAVDFRFIGKFAGGGGFEDLYAPPYNAATLRDRFVRYTFPQATNAKGQLTALPADIGPGTLLYRKDLIDRAGLTEADLTKSWESLLQAGRQIKARTGAYLMADSADLRDMLLRIGLQDGEGIFFDRNGRVLVDTPRFRRAFEMGLAAQRAGLSMDAQAWTNEWVAGFRNGRVATQMMGAWLAGHLKNWLAPDASGLWRSTVLPGGAYGSFGGSFYAIPRKARYKAEAWDFIRFMAADRQTQVESLRVLDSFPALIEAQDDPMFGEPIAYLGGQKARLLWRDIASKVPTIPVNRLDAMATDVMRAEYGQVIQEGKDIGQALKDAQFLIERRSRRP